MNKGNETSLAGLSVLVLDDETLLRRRLTAHLEALGADVTGADTVATARQHLATFEFDFALLDIHLPDGLGLDLLRSGAIPSSTGAIVMTAQGGVETAVEALRLGAISAHLMHGLKNPLASLSQFVSQHRGGSDTPAESEDWQDALTASRRMQSLVEQTLEVLGDARGEPTYELSVKELVADVQKRVAPAATSRGVTLTGGAAGACTMSSRTANLASLVLVNLLENAIEATPAGGTVSLSAAREDGRVQFRVRDGGAGFPAHLREQIFRPCKSTRDGGSGIGLAISKQIADHLGAELELAESSQAGCVFALALPGTACEEK